MKTEPAIADRDRVAGIASPTLCDVLDRVLTKGVVVDGEITIAVADIDLVYLGLRLMLTSIETARNSGLVFKNDTRLE